MLAIPKNARGPERVLVLLRVLAQHPQGLSLAQIAEALAAPKSSLLTLLLRPLTQLGYLARSGETYTLGVSAYALAADMLSGRDLGRMLLPFAEELLARTRESVSIAVLDREQAQAIYLLCIDSPQTIRYSTPSGTRRPLYCSAAGRLLLAYQDAPWIDHYIDRLQLAPLTPTTVRSRTELRKKLAEVRTSGMAVSLGEFIADAGGLAAPVFGPHGELLAALLISAPVERFKRELPHLQYVLQDVAARACAGLPGPGGEASTNTRRAPARAKESPRA